MDLKYSGDGPYHVNCASFNHAHLPSFLAIHHVRGGSRGVSHSMLEDRQTFRGGAYIMITGFQRFPVNTKHLYNICNKLSFHHLKLGIALAIQALNECKIKTNNSAT